MSKVMETTSMARLWARMAGEYRAMDSVWGIPALAFRSIMDLAAASPGYFVLDRRVSLPLGPAAGPHTQCAPAIIAAWLAGARVFELKTVQVNDRLDIAKPCIDALDEGHNTEWSTELSLDEARGEYLRAWIAIHALEALLSAEAAHDGSSFEGPDAAALFNLSVGYTLEGIQNPAMDTFIEGMLQPAGTAVWIAAVAETLAALDGPACRQAFGEAACARAMKALARLSDEPIHSITLSTMHGCPPEEIGRIAGHLMEAKRADVYVKLNPTLLGYRSARWILDATGWRSIELKEESFTHDLQYPRALELIASLRAAAASAGVRFGLKLSNTLANRNTTGFLPGGERYLSGRALFPLTVELAARLARDLPEPLPFSFCGGVSAFNAPDCLAAGLGPLTLATDLLKPGGYLRLSDIAHRLAAVLPGAPVRPDAEALAHLAAASLTRPEFRGDWKRGQAAIPRPLPSFDCFAAPCVAACPVHQQVPRYLRQAGAAEFQSAIDTIIADNPLPRITGTLCDHVCMSRCSRLDYDGPIAIRDVKLACSRAAEPRIGRQPNGSAGRDAPAVAVVGAGPAGLSCAWHLALAGVRVVVFDRDPAAAGVVANVIPPFRIARDDIASDVDRIKTLGVEFQLGTAINGPAGIGNFAAVFLASGAPVPRRLPLKGDGVRRIDALEFLRRCGGPDKPAFPGVRRILVAGGGNTAMDACRAALTQAGVATVHLAYRRTRVEMPALREELEHCLDEGTVLMELCQPEALEAGHVVLRGMVLGPRDPSGRRAPLPSAETATLECDLLVEAIGEQPDAALLKAFGVTIDQDGRPVVDSATLESGKPGVFVGGDAGRGPASIIAAAADGRKAARAMLVRFGLAGAAGETAPVPPSATKLAARGRILPPAPTSSVDFLATEAGRCLECDAACLRCVEVCPNRANIAIPVTPADGFQQAWQILHVDRMCNQCGNCGRFCPWDGDPCQTKPALFAGLAALETATNPGFAFVDGRAGSEESTAALPHLALRETPGAPPRLLPAETWLAAPATLPASAFLALARVLWRDHRYLLAPPHHSEGGSQ